MARSKQSAKSWICAVFAGGWALCLNRSFGKISKSALAPAVLAGNLALKAVKSKTSLSKRWRVSCASQPFSQSLSVAARSSPKLPRLRGTAYAPYE